MLVRHLDLILCSCYCSVWWPNINALKLEASERELLLVSDHGFDIYFVRADVNVFHNVAD